MSKRAASPPTIAPKRARAHTPERAPTLDAWLKPDAEPPLLASSPHLNASTSTFVAFTYSFEPPNSVRSVPALAKEARRIVRELDAVRLVGPELLRRGEGAFQHGEGRALGKRERAREPDHRMWAVRALGLKEGRDGTRGEDDYQLLEAFDDDGEKYGGERVLRVLQEQHAVDVLTICCRWYGGDLLGPARFHHIGITAQDSLSELLTLVARRDLRAQIVQLDADIAGMRATLASQPTPGPAGQSASAQPDPSATPASSAPQSTPPSPSSQPTYADIDDVARLERLVKAREKTRENLEKRVGWAALEGARGE